MVTAGGPNLSWLKPFGIGLCILYKTTLGLLVFALMSTLTKDEPELPRWIGRPPSLGFLPIWPNFVHVVPAFKYSPKPVELVNISEFSIIMAYLS